MLVSLKEKEEEEKRSRLASVGCKKKENQIYLYSKARTSDICRSLQRYTLRTRHGRSEMTFSFFAHVHNYKYANDMIE